jgi:hypothetical protein
MKYNTPGSLNTGFLGSKKFVALFEFCLLLTLLLSLLLVTFLALHFLPVLFNMKSCLCL